MRYVDRLCSIEINRCTTNHNQSVGRDGGCSGEYYNMNNFGEKVSFIWSVADLLSIPDADVLTKKGIVKTVYDPACGTGGMISEVAR